MQQKSNLYLQSDSMNMMYHFIIKDFTYQICHFFGDKIFNCFQFL